LARPDHARGPDPHYPAAALLLARAVRELAASDWRAPDMDIERAEISLPRANSRRAKLPPARITYAEREFRVRRRGFQ